ncbi:dUTP diphosphatase [archaeon]|nr:dUTP diphosphatase [archaeon]
MDLIHRQSLLLNPVVKFVKTHPDAQLPKPNVSAEHAIGTGDSGYDLVAVEDTLIPWHQRHPGSAVVPVGLTLAYIENGYWFRIEPRSGLGFKHSLQPHLGIIDNGYRGDLGVKLYNFSEKQYTVKKGDRIAQLVVYPLIQPQCSWADEIVNSDRGDKGFGSSGN